MQCSCILGPFKYVIGTIPVDNTMLIKCSLLRLHIHDYSCELTSNQNSAETLKLSGQQQRGLLRFTALWENVRAVRCLVVAPFIFTA